MFLHICPGHGQGVLTDRTHDQRGGPFNLFTTTGRTCLLIGVKHELCSGTLASLTLTGPREQTFWNPEDIVAFIACDGCRRHFFISIGFDHRSCKQKNRKIEIDNGRTKTEMEEMGLLDKNASHTSIQLAGKDTDRSQMRSRP